MFGFPCFQGLYLHMTINLYYIMVASNWFVDEIKCQSAHFREDSHEHYRDRNSGRWGLIQRRKQA